VSRFRKGAAWRDWHGCPVKIDWAALEAQRLARLAAEALPSPACEKCEENPANYGSPMDNENDPRDYEREEMEHPAERRIQEDDDRDVAYWLD